MKKKFIISLLLGLLFINTACEDLDRDAMYPTQYRKLLYLKTNGIVDMTLYKTGENTEYQFSVVKTGAYPELTADVKLQTMSSTELAAYCEPRGLDLKALSESCYSLSGTQLQFVANEGYKLITLDMNATAIGEQIEADVSTSEYVIPLILKSDQDSINSTMNILIIKPTVVTPAIVFTTPGMTETYCGKGITNIQVPMELQIDNKWDFTCKVVVDPTAIGESELLTRGYTLENNGVVTFAKGSRKAMLNVKFDRAAAGMTNIDFASPVLPLRISEVSIPTFDVDKKSVQLGISCKYPLTLSMLATNAQEPSEGPLANVLDGNLNTFFHTAWSIGVTGQHYAQVNLPEALSSFRFSYTNRAANGSAALAQFILGTSTDGTSFSVLKEYSKEADGLPVTGAGTYNSAIMKPAAAAKSIRFTCVKNWTGGAYFVWSEFSLYGF